jgi:quercetin dioxygenase-like cupin family protein
MAIHKYSEIALSPVEMDGVIGTSMANVIGADQGWANHTLRVFRIEPGGHTPRHQHAWEHINFVITGRGRLRLGDVVREIGAKDFAVVPGHTEHQFENPFDEPFEFICIVPNSAYQQ